MRRVLVLLSVMFLSACGGRGVVDKGNTSNKANPATTQSNSCSGTQLTSRIVNIAAGAQFRDIVVDLVSATLSSAEVGDISGAATGSTGVSILMNLKFDSSHQIDSNNSQFRLVIRDSLVGQKSADGQTIDPIEIEHGGSSTLQGSYDPTQRILNLIFNDPYGSIQVQGSIQNDVLEGTVSFSNSVAWDGGAPRSGTLGTFQARSCNFQ